MLGWRCGRLVSTFLLFLSRCCSRAGFVRVREKGGRERSGGEERRRGSRSGA